VSYRFLQVEAEGPVLTIRIDRPEVRNALHPAAHAEMAAALDAFAAEDRLRVAVITGTGEKAFCVGSDLKVRAEMGRDDMPATGFAGIAARFDLFKPVIAAVNGDAIGGGLEIVLASDLAVAVEGARFGLPEPKVGLAAAGGLHRLARSIPDKWAMEVALTGRLFGAEEALRLGLVNRVVSRGALAATVRALAEEVAANAPLSVRATKQMMRQGLGQPSLEAAFAVRYAAHEAMLASEDAVEGPRAFAEKRRPVWKGR
jgi:enoyl-CoA hydratase/carnithine racemase